VAELFRLQQGYLAQSQRAAADHWSGQTVLGRLKVNLAKLFSPLL